MRSHKVVPERGMPTMNTGAASRLAARGPSAKRSRVKHAMLAWIVARYSSRENGCEAASSLCAALQCAKARACWPWPERNLARS